MPISKKQKQILAFPYTHYDALIADGAIRSGKTVFMILAFIDWAMADYNGQRFAICGKTVDSAVKNIITPYLGLKYAQEKYALHWRRSDKLLIVRKGQRENIFEVFGGKDESSFMLIQGRTLAGVLLDEVALQPRSFVEQALARCSVDGSKFWFNCNPDSPQHWFYQEWVKDPAQRNAIRLHFQLEDNPSLSEKIVERYKSMHPGVFYQRYILGEWVVAEGLVYNFTEENIVDDDDIPDGFLDTCRWDISIDYGTLNPFSAGLWATKGDLSIRIDEYYYSGRDTHRPRTDEEHYEALKKMVGDREIAHVVVDPSAASFIEVVRRAGEWSVRKAKNDVMHGIELTASLLSAGAIKIHRRCSDAINEFGLYRWDEESSEDRVIKENDHAMDDIRYHSLTTLRRNAAIMRRVGRRAEDEI